MNGLIIDACRDITDGAYVRTMNGDSIGDNAYVDLIHDTAMQLHADLNGSVPWRTLRSMLWRAADVGADHAHKDSMA
jgi:hypothetical protein